MAITRSAKKALRASARKRVFNLRRQSTMKDSVKDFKTLIAKGKVEEAAALLSKAFQALDKAAKTGVIKKQNADRKKSRLSKMLKKVS